jgi:hypothetical protein
MAEELRFFLRTAAYSAILAAIYWFASFDQRTQQYDWAGTALLVFVVLAAGVIVAVGSAAVRATRGEIVPRTGSALSRGAGAVNRLVGFEEHGGATERQPLAGGPEAYARRSGWPLLAGFAVLLAGTGLVFGEWLLFPGIAVGALAAWGWLTQLDAPR